MSQMSRKLNRDLRAGSNVVEPGTVLSPCDVEELKRDAARCIIGVQDVHLSINLSIRDVAILQGIILGDDVDYVDLERQVRIL